MLRLRRCYISIDSSHWRDDVMVLFTPVHHTALHPRSPILIKMLHLVRFMAAVARVSTPQDPVALSQRRQLLQT